MLANYYIKIFNSNMNTNLILKCPVCGGCIIPSDEGWECDNQLNAVTPCVFAVDKQIRGTTITEDIVRELCQSGRSRILTMKDKTGKQYLAHLEVQNGKVEVMAEGLSRTDSSHRMSWRLILTDIRPSLTAVSIRRGGSSLPFSRRTSRSACR